MPEPLLPSRLDVLPTQRRIADLTVERNYKRLERHLSQLHEAGCVSRARRTGTLFV
jgi:hypothetical protein